MIKFWWRSRSQIWIWIHIATARETTFGDPSSDFLRERMAQRKHICPRGQSPPDVPPKQVPPHLMDDCVIENNAVLATDYRIDVIIMITKSTGTVHTSAKVRLTNVAIRIHIQVRHPDRHQNLIICALAYYQPSLKI